MTQLSQQVGVSVASAWRIARKDLGIFPYKIQIGQPLTEQSCEKRYEFCTQVDAMIDDNEIDPANIIFTDEAHFWLNGYVNRQNYRIWGTQRPEHVVAKPLHPLKLTVFCAINADGILGPYFFEETINGERYHEFIKETFIPDAVNENWLTDCWFQQDGAPPHTTRDNLQLLNEWYGPRVIARNYPATFNCGLAWPPYSPDLSPLDFFLWGYVKDKVYQEPPQNLDDLRKKISAIVKKIPVEMCKKTIDSFQERIKGCITTKGRHFENIIF